MMSSLYTSPLSPSVIQVPALEDDIGLNDPRPVGAEIAQESYFNMVLSIICVVILFFALYLWAMLTQGKPTS